VLLCAAAAAARSVNCCTTAATAFAELCVEQGMRNSSAVSVVRMQWYYATCAMLCCNTLGSSISVPLSAKLVCTCIIHCTVIQ
jgi:hypothetical protein